MNHLHVDDIPELSDPLFIMAFEGWNDAAQSATIAARYLINRFDGKRFAWLESEDFFQYSDQRPHVRLDRDGKRVITWPTNEFFYCKHPDLPRDLVVGVGVEPQLRWQLFSEGVFELVQTCGARLTVTLGSLLAGDSHTNPIELVCLANEPHLADRTGVKVTKYEGPTGIVGVIHTKLQDQKISAVSLWANIPHYISSLPNPKGAYALLDCLGAVGEIEIDLGELERSADQFDAQIEEAIAQDPKIAKYFSEMEEEGEFSEEESEQEEPGELPSGDQLVDEIESYLRRRKDDGESD
jgi:proteasome assembly chaperone (PAC2) family protein